MLASMRVLMVMLMVVIMVISIRVCVSDYWNIYA